MENFRSDSILDTPPAVSNAAAANALVPAAKTAASEEGGAEDESEGPRLPFEPNTPSGFCCRHCRAPLFVGSRACPQCQHAFTVPTPDADALRRSTHALKSFGGSLVYKDRITDAEAARGQQALPPITPSVQSEPRPPSTPTTKPVSRRRSRDPFLARMLWLLAVVVAVLLVSHLAPLRPPFR